MILATLPSTCSIMFIGCNNTNNPNDNSTHQTQDSLPTNTIETPTIQALNEMIKSHPDSADLLYQRGQAYQQSGNVAGAVRDYQQAINIDSSKTAYYHALSGLFFLLPDLDQAIMVMKLGLQVNPKDTMGLLKLGQYYFYQQDNKTSMAYLNKALMEDKFLAEAYFWKYLNLAELKDTTKAIANLQTVIELNTEYLPAYLELGDIYAARGDAKAIGYYDNVLRLDSNNLDAWLKKGLYYQHTQDYPNAIQTFKKIIGRDPQNAKGFYNLGHAYFQADSLEQAYKHFDFTTKVDPANANAYYMKGLTVEMQGNMQTAQQFYKQALKLNPDLDLARKGLLRIQQEQQ